MSKGYLQIELGGKKQGLKFNIGAFRFIGELTNGDPLRFAKSSDDLGEQYRIVKTLVHAGLLSNALSKGVDPDFTDKDVTAWVSELSAAEGSEIINAFAEANSTEKEDSDKKKLPVRK